MDGGCAAASELPEGEDRGGGLWAADRDCAGKGRAVFAGDPHADSGALWTAAHVWISRQRHDGIHQGDIARRPGAFLATELFSGRCSAGRYWKHQIGGVEAAAGKTVRGVEGRENCQGGGGYARDNGRETDSCGPSGSAADNASVLLDGVGAIHAGL